MGRVPVRVLVATRAVRVVERTLVQKGLTTMNIFFVDMCPMRAAQSLHDKHVVKMVLELAQMLSAAHHLNKSRVTSQRVYKLTHRHHPMTKWVSAHEAHYKWAFHHFLALLDEYTYRYGKRHKCSDLVGALSIVPSFLGTSKPCNPPLCMPDEYKDANTHHVISYRAYYVSSKLTYTSQGTTRQHTWTKRPKPSWVIKYGRDFNNEVT